MARAIVADATLLHLGFYKDKKPQKSSNCGFIPTFKTFCSFVIVNLYVFNAFLTECLAKGFFKVPCFYQNS